MLQINHSNQLEKLASELLTSYKDNGAHPLTPRIIVTESSSLARWLKHQFCQYDGISCLLETPMPAEWIWKQARTLLKLPTEVDPLTREPMQWLIHAALADDSVLSQAHDNAQVTTYLSKDDTGLKRWQLSGRIADCFDRYQYYRPELIEKWSNGEDKQWQAELWREISKDVATNRVALMRDFLNQLEHTPESGFLPERLDLFSIHNLPPLLLNAFVAIARHIPVNIWLLAPTEQYWADLVSPREKAKKRLNDLDNLVYWEEEGNPLLTQWGRQGQVFQDLILEISEPESEEAAFFKHSKDALQTSILSNLQTDIYNAVDEEGTLLKSIHEKSLTSVQIHICHSAMRECQVLHDTLLHCLKDNPKLEPEDILVLVPEISRYAPYIEAVFGRTAPGIKEKQLPFNLSDIVLADEHPLINAFLSLLELPESRFTRTELLRLLDLPEVRRTFGLNPEDSIELTETFDELRIFWGFDGEDKQQRFKLPAIEDNTWQQGFNRIMAGFCLGSEKLYSGIAPLTGLTSQDAEPAARFFDLLNTLREWAKKLQDENTTATKWAEILNRLLLDIFGENKDEDDRLSQIRNLLGELEETGSSNSATLTRTVIHNWLTKTLSTRADRCRFYSGGVTFCGMQPLRGVPFKVICLLGMQDQAFPRRHKNVEFDLMAKKWLHGDPDPALEDRYLFLETLLAARERLIISYTGRNNRNNEALQPSVVVQELIDYMDEHYTVNNEKPSEKLTRVHSLQAFGRSNFSNNIHRSFDDWWLATAKTVIKHEAVPAIADWPVISVSSKQQPSRLTSPVILSRFFKHPVKYFIQQQLHIYEPSDIEVIEDEPFDLDNLEQWQILNQLLEHWQQDETDGSDQMIMACGMLPHGSLGEKILTEKKAEYHEVIATLEAIPDIQPPLKKLPIDINLKLPINGKAWQLAGRLQYAYEEIGLLQISASNYELHKVMPLWIEHLCLHATEHPQAGTSRFICKDASMRLPTIDAKSALEHLKVLIELYETGLSTPLPFMPKSSSRYVAKWAETEDEEKAINEALKAWDNKQPNRYTGENEDFFTSLMLRGHEWKPDEDFADYALRILDPLQSCLEELV
jgi:exodeoxyribonuclease V gamma subunit